MKIRYKLITLPSGGIISNFLNTYDEALKKRNNREKEGYKNIYLLPIICE